MQTFMVWARPIAGVAIIVALAYRFGAEPFIDGLRRVDASSMLLALAVTAVTTWCCARRWSLLAERLGVEISVPAAYRACYRAQLLNATLPGGVVGDVHRAVRHGRDAGDLGRGLRSVVWDRVTGQVVQAGLALLAALLLLPGMVDAWAAWLVGLAAVLAIGHLGLPRRFVRAIWTEARTVPGAPGVWQRVTVLSMAAAAGHVLVFIVAARTAGVTAPNAEVIGLGLVVLLASAIPLNVAGWGPREGTAAAIFGAAGLGSGTGLEVSVVYGVLALVATLPGLLVLKDPRVRISSPAAGTWRAEEVPHG